MIKLTFRTLFCTSEVILEEPLQRGEEELYTDYFMHYNALFLCGFPIIHNFL